MKTKLIYVIALILLAQFANAQTFGIKGGLNFSSMKFSEGGTGYTPSILAGMQFGPVAEFKLNHSLFLNTGVLYSLKGFNLKSVSDDQVQNASFFNGKAKLSYFELPVNLAYKMKLKNNYQFIVQGGPYAALSAGGTIKKPGYPLQDVYQYHYLNSYDYGVGAGVGIEKGPLVASLNYEYGLLNLNSNSAIPATFNNRTLQLSIAYMFWHLHNR